MTELLLLALGASLVNNFVLSNFLGLCPFIGVSRRFEAAAGMALATLFVLTIASGLSFMVRERRSGTPDASDAAAAVPAPVSAAQNAISLPGWTGIH